MAIKKRPVSPRQKMINLMYVVLMAMLALNVSNEDEEEPPEGSAVVRQVATGQGNEQQALQVG